jgi:hypothetical protein
VREIETVIEIVTVIVIVIVTAIEIEIEMVVAIAIAIVTTAAVAGIDAVVAEVGVPAEAAVPRVDGTPRETTDATTGTVSVTVIVARIVNDTGTAIVIVIASGIEAGTVSAIDAKRKTLPRWVRAYRPPRLRP